MDARTSRYHEIYARAMRDPEGFWGEAAAAIDWYEPAKKVFRLDYKWSTERCGGAGEPGEYLASVKTSGRDGTLPSHGVARRRGSHHRTAGRNCFGNARLNAAAAL